MSTVAIERRIIRMMLQDQSGHPLCGPFELDQQIQDSTRMIHRTVGLPDIVRAALITLTLNENEYAVTGSFVDRLLRLTQVSTGLDLKKVDEDAYRWLHRGNPPPRGIPSRWAMVKVMDTDETDAVWKVLVTPEPGTAEVGLVFDLSHSIFPLVFTDAQVMPLDDDLCQVLREHVSLTVCSGWTQQQRSERQLDGLKMAEWRTSINEGLVEGWKRRNQGRLPEKVVDVYY